MVKKAKSPGVGVLWDTHHTCVRGKESPAETFKALGPPMCGMCTSRTTVPDDSGDKYVLTGDERCL